MDLRIYLILIKLYPQNLLEAVLVSARIQSNIGGGVVGRGFKSSLSGVAHERWGSYTKTVT